MENNKIVVDLDHPVWLSEPGYGNKGMTEYPYCALGKLCQAADMVGGYSSSYKLLANQDEVVQSIWRTNDGSFDFVSGKQSKQDHKKAIRMVLEALAKNPNVELKGTKVSDVIKETVNV